MTGIWAAALLPFDEQLRIDEDGFRQNIHHWVHDLGIEGLFVTGKQGEFFSLSVEERKRTFDLAVEATGDAGQTIMSCSDQNLDVVLDRCLTILEQAHEQHYLAGTSHLFGVTAIILARVDRAETGAELIGSMIANGHLPRGNAMRAMERSVERTAFIRNSIHAVPKSQLWESPRPSTTTFHSSTCPSGMRRPSRRPRKSSEALTPRLVVRSTALAWSN